MMIVLTLDSDLESSISSLFSSSDSVYCVSDPEEIDTESKNSTRAVGFWFLNGSLNQWV